MEQLQTEWRDLYAKRLPAMAKAKDKKQERWPVYLDHCFARIILDNAVGKDAPWTEVIKSPAVKNMTERQLKDALKLGTAIADGEQDINTLNERSLRLRGKVGPNKQQKIEQEINKTAEARSASKRDLEEDDEQSLKKHSKKSRNKNTNISTYFLQAPTQPTISVEAADVAEAAKKAADQDVSVQLKRIADSDLTAFRKQTLSMLCQIPRGQYSTYQAMSDYITKTSHKTCARAVGNAMRNNPFAPEVPCHRILAADGTLGGFGGHWGEAGKFADKKHELLKEEGVRFDSMLKVKGPPFRDFHAVT